MKNIDYNEIAIFVKVAEAGSFSGAAKILNMPNSTVSVRISDLERRLGLTLIQRTTRKLSLTPVGEIYFKQCKESLASIQNIEQQICLSSKEPQGRLRISVPYVLGESVLATLIAEFIQKYPKVEVELSLQDSVVDLVEEGFDLAIRAGNFKDSSMIIKKLGYSYFATFAAPAFIEKYGKPEHPKDLKNFACLHYPPLGIERWDFQNEKTKVRVNVGLSGKYVVSNLSSLRAIMIAGAGIGLLPMFMCEGGVKDGKLVRVLPQWTSVRHQVNFIYPAQRFVNPNVKAFIGYSSERLSKMFINQEVL